MLAATIQASQSMLESWPKLSNEVAVVTSVTAATAIALHPSTRLPALGELTAREREVLGLLVRGLSNPEICKSLVISDATAKTHVAHILQKLGLRDRVQAVIYAYESGLITPGQLDA
jgi:DNA-binding NarL/FixJ family response regulator